MKNIIYKTSNTDLVVKLTAGELKLYFYLVDHAKDNLVDLKALDKDDFKKKTSFKEKTFYNNISSLIKKEFLVRGKRNQLIFLNDKVVEIGDFELIQRNKILVKYNPDRLIYELRGIKSKKTKTPKEAEEVSEEALRAWEDIRMLDDFACRTLALFIRFLTMKVNYLELLDGLERPREYVLEKDYKNMSKYISAYEDELKLLREDKVFYDKLARSIILISDITEITENYNDWLKIKSEPKRVNGYINGGYGRYSIKMRGISIDVFDNNFKRESCELFLEEYSYFYSTICSNMCSLENSKSELKIQNKEILRETLTLIDGWLVDLKQTSHHLFV